MAGVRATSLCAAGCLTQNNWLSTARGRVGYVLDRFLVYSTGGAALGNVRRTSPTVPSATATV